MPHNQLAALAATVRVWLAGGTNWLLDGSRTIIVIGTFLHELNVRLLIARIIVCVRECGLSACVLVCESVFTGSGLITGKCQSVSVDDDFEVSIASSESIPWASGISATRWIITIDQVRTQ